jgi:hypothetical protein
MTTAFFDDYPFFVAALIDPAQSAKLHLSIFDGASASRFTARARPLPAQIGIAKRALFSKYTCFHAETPGQNHDPVPIDAVPIDALPLRGASFEFDRR